MLDLSMVNDDSKVFFDVRSSGFDYVEGFDGLDSALLYENLLFDQTNNEDYDSS